MNGGKPHGGRAYDSNFSAFQKKGLISPLQKNGDKKKDLPAAPSPTYVTQRSGDVVESDKGRMQKEGAEELYTESYEKWAGNNRGTTGWTKGDFNKIANWVDSEGESQPGGKTLSKIVSDVQHSKAYKKRT
jgi:hypothetical protein